MPIAHEHELHRRRFGRNMGVLLTLAAFVALVFGLTIAKAQRGESVEAFDHTYRTSIDTTLPRTTQGDR
ncbi:MAG: hypothetical protein R3D60_06130 [Paracoccaceae bacterium]